MSIFSYKNEKDAFATTAHVNLCILVHGDRVSAEAEHPTEPTEYDTNLVSDPTFLEFECLQEWRSPCPIQLRGVQNKWNGSNS